MSTSSDTGQSNVENTLTAAASIAARMNDAIWDKYTGLVDTLSNFHSNMIDSIMLLGGKIHLAGDLMSGISGSNDYKVSQSNLQLAQFILKNEKELAEHIFEFMGTRASACNVQDLGGDILEFSRSHKL